MGEHTRPCRRCASMGHCCYAWPWPQLPEGSQRCYKCVDCLKSKQSCSNARKPGEWLHLPAAFAAEVASGSPTSSFADVPYIDWSSFLQAAGSAVQVEAASSSGDSGAVVSMLQPHVGANVSSRGSTVPPPGSPRNPNRLSPSVARQPSAAPSISRRPSQTGQVPPAAFPLAPVAPDAWPRASPARGSVPPSISASPIHSVRGSVPPRNPTTPPRSIRSEIPPPNPTTPPRSVRTSVPPSNPLSPLLPPVMPRSPRTPERPSLPVVNENEVSPTLRSRFRTIESDLSALDAQRQLMDIRYRRAQLVESQVEATSSARSLLETLRPLWQHCRRQLDALELRQSEVEASFRNDDFLVRQLRLYDHSQRDSFIVDREFVDGFREHASLDAVPSEFPMPPVLVNPFDTLLPSTAPRVYGSVCGRAVVASAGHGRGSPSSGRGRGEPASSQGRGTPGPSRGRGGANHPSPRPGQN